MLYLIIGNILKFVISLPSKVRKSEYLLLNYQENKWWVVDLNH